jgi:hypothetical protein
MAVSDLRDNILEIQKNTSNEKHSTVEHKGINWINHQNRVTALAKKMTNENPKPTTSCEAPDLLAVATVEAVAAPTVVSTVTIFDFVSAAVVLAAVVSAAVVLTLSVCADEDWAAPPLEYPSARHVDRSWTSSADKVALTAA